MKFQLFEKFEQLLKQQAARGQACNQLKNT